MDITFHNEFSGFKLGRKRMHRHWLREQIRARKKYPDGIAIIFTSNEDLRKINQSFLNHNHFTDVITFGYGQGDRISGDIFISIEQVNKNANDYHVSFEEELRRVMIHGVLHLMGYNDQDEKEREEMRKLEDEALFLWGKGGGNGSDV